MKRTKPHFSSLLLLQSRRRLVSGFASVAGDTSPASFGMDSESYSSERFCFNPALRWKPEVEQYFVSAYGADHFARISKALTHPSSYSCVRVNIMKSSTDAVIKKLMMILNEERLQNTVAETDDKLGEANLSEMSVLEDSFGSIVAQEKDIPNRRSQDLSVSKCPYPGLDNVVFVKGSGPHMFQYDNQVSQPMKEVIVSRKCAEAVLRGAQVYVPGVLACSAHVEKGDLVAVSVAMEQPTHDGGWGVGITRGTVLLGLKSDPQYHERNGLYIGQGTALLSRASIFRVTEGVAVEMRNKVYELPSFNDVLKGEIFLQNLPSIVTAYVLDPQEGERILDMCAAPGGKTTAIAMLMKDKGEVVATDRSHNKVMDILKLAAEMDLTCINAYKLDALKSVRRDTDTNVKFEAQNIPVTTPKVGFPTSTGITIEEENTVSDLSFSQSVSNGTIDKRYHSKAEQRKNTRRMRNGPGRHHSIGGRVEDSKGFLPNSFDRVLLDAPCSALGLRPRLFVGEETMQSLRSHRQYQRKMFDQAVQLVRPGGVLVYSTCTINPGENEALVRYALDTYKFLSLAPQHPKIGGPGIVGSCNLYDGAYVEEWLTEREAELVQRFDPSSTLDTIGFFIAKFDVGQKEQ